MRRSCVMCFVGWDSVPTGSGQSPKLRKTPLQLLALLPELRRVAVEVAQQLDEVRPGRSVRHQLLTEAAGVVLLGRAEAAVTAAIIRRTDCSAARLSHRAETRHALRDRDANGASAFAVEAHAVRRRLRFVAGDERRDDLDQLIRSGDLGYIRSMRLGEQVEQLQSRSQQPLRQRGRDLSHDVVTDLEIRVAELTQFQARDRDGQH